MQIDAYVYVRHNRSLCQQCATSTLNGCNLYQRGQVMLITRFIQLVTLMPEVSSEETLLNQKLYHCTKSSHQICLQRARWRLDANQNYTNLQMKSCSFLFFFHKAKAVWCNVKMLTQFYSHCGYISETIFIKSTGSSISQPTVELQLIYNIYLVVAIFFFSKQSTTSFFPGLCSH